MRELERDYLMAFRGTAKTVPHSRYGTEMAIMERFPQYRLEDVADLPADFVDEFACRLRAEAKAQPKEPKLPKGTR